MPETATYIYCLVEQSRPPATARMPRGLPGSTTPDPVSVGRTLFAIAADAPLRLYSPDRLEARLRDIQWVADIAVAHESVVEHCAAARGATVVPMKLFTMFSTRDRAIADLTARRREVDAILDRIRGCQEWGVRITRLPPAAGARRTATARATSGTAFLAAKKQARDEAREALLEAAVAAERALETLTGIATLVRRHSPPETAATPPLVDAAFLVPSGRRARFRTAASRLARSCRTAGASLTLTGPWPAYNFVHPEGEAS